MTRTADLVIVGLGAVGAAALYQSAKMGARVIGIDRFEPPHDQGSSHGDTRITRQAIGEGRDFVPLVLRSNQIWEELESATGHDLITRNGGLILASPVVSHHHGSASFIQDTLDTAVEFRIPHEVLTAVEVRSRYPQFRLRGDEVGYFEARAGFLRPETCIDAQLRAAKHYGAEVLSCETVIAAEPAADGTIKVRTDKGHYSAAKVLLTVGPWIQKLLGPELAWLFKVYRQVMNWFAVAQHADRYSPDRFPVFIWITGPQPHDMLYGFPAVDGPEAGMKISTEQYESPVDPDSVVRTYVDSEVAAMHAEYIAPRLPDISSRCLRSQVCLYTVTPDAKFVIDHLHSSENIWFASACSGHGFKHSAALGEALVQRALGCEPSVDLSPFRLNRFASWRESYRGVVPGGSGG